MSFSQQVKKEITEKELHSPCCIHAACYGIALFGREFTPQGFSLYTEKAYIANWAKLIFSQAGIIGKVFVRGSEGTSYEFAVQDPFEVEKMLVLFGHTGDEPALRIHGDQFLCNGCFAAFTAAAFICCGMVVTPKKEYSLEFVSPRHNLTGDFEELLKTNGFTPKRTLRKGSNVLYFRASEPIEDLLTLMGAGKSTLEIMHQKVYKDLRNRANRITNCETANIDKIIMANQQTLESIKILEDNKVLQTLSEPLQLAAKMRKAHPDYSLAELAELFEEPVSKSGLSHRYRKLCQLAEEIQAKSE